jgi:hypothetical protein
MTVSEENNYSSAGLQGVFKPESSLPNQAKLKKKNLCGGKGGFYPRMIFPCPDRKASV